MQATDKINNLRSKYEMVVEELYIEDNFKKSGHKLIDSHFDYIMNFTQGVFTKLQEKAILAQGELISTSLFHLLATGEKYQLVSTSGFKLYADR